MSGTVVTAHGPAASYQQIVTKDVRESLTTQSLRCWKLDAETTDHGVLFLQGATVISEATTSFTLSDRMKSSQTKVDDAQTRASDLKWDGGGRTTAAAVSGRASKQTFDDAGRLSKSQGREGFLATGEGVRAFIEQWALPFLDEYDSTEAFVRGYENGDGRLLLTQSSYVIVAAAYLTLDRTAEATAVLEKHLGKPGLRMQFSSAFAFHGKAPSRREHIENSGMTAV